MSNISEVLEILHGVQRNIHEYTMEVYLDKDYRDTHLCLLGSAIRMLEEQIELERLQKGGTVTTGDDDGRKKVSSLNHGRRVD